MTAICTRELTTEEGERKTGKEGKREKRKGGREGRKDRRKDGERGKKEGKKKDRG